MAKTSPRKKRSKPKLNQDTQLDYLFRKGVNLRGRTLTLTGEIEEGWFRLVDAALSEFEARSNRPITIRVNSPGGFIYEAMSVVGRIKKSPCKIYTEGYGSVMSAATLILASGHQRKISRYSWFMHHEFSYDVGGKHSEIKRFSAQVEREWKEWANWMGEFTKKDAAFWLKVGTDKDAYFKPEELLELGVVDAID